mmetsp:Transcript_7994/g.17823  ORF Transcript_7994/g.17823 Transcript_7994/m.17823 type:complete len:312 (-) Transcript_7994:561-1496(-)
MLLSSPGRRRLKSRRAPRTQIGLGVSTRRSQPMTVMVMATTMTTRARCMIPPLKSQSGCRAVGRRMALNRSGLQRPALEGKSLLGRRITQPCRMPREQRSLQRRQNGSAVQLLFPQSGRSSTARMSLHPCIRHSMLVESALAGLTLLSTSSTSTAEKGCQVLGRTSTTWSGSSEPGLPSWPVQNEAAVQQPQFRRLTRPPRRRRSVNSQSECMPLTSTTSTAGSMWSTSQQTEHWLTLVAIRWLVSVEISPSSRGLSTRVSQTSSLIASSPWMGLSIFQARLARWSMSAPWKAISSVPWRTSLASSDRGGR